MNSTVDTRVFRGFFATTVMAASAVAIIAYEWNFERTRVATTAVVVEPSVSFGRTVLKIAEVVYSVNGKPRQARLRTFCYGLKVNQQVAILYLPEDPGAIVPLLFWERHFSSTIALAAFAIFALYETGKLRSERRRRSRGLALLGDDPVEVFGELTEDQPN